MAALLVAVLVVPLPAATAEASGFRPADIVFPVVGETTFVDDFGDPRSGGRIHEGVDLMTGVKGVPIVAAAAGTVSWVGAGCCFLAIDHGGGWSTWYIHLDNDTPGTDDGEGWGIAEDIDVGAAVDQGELIGWSGDSGNAESSPPHLHFEIRKNGVAINPYRHLMNAPRLDGPGGRFVSPFVDTEGNVHADDIDELYRRRITKGCNPPDNDRYCPGDHITRGQIAAFLRRFLELPASPTDHFVDDGGSVFEDDINAITEAGVGFGCDAGRFCPGAPLRREEMAELVVRAFAPTDPERYRNTGGDRYIDDAESRFQRSINRLSAAGVTYGCNPPLNDRFCPTEPLTRAQMASFFVRAMDS